jgi:recombinational DNA repair protein RecR
MDASSLSHSPTETSSELCPKCGQFTDIRGLSEVTGWCHDCTNQTTFIVNVTSSSNAVEMSLAANVVAVQHYVLQGQSIWQALVSARGDRPRCVVCGNIIRRAKRNAIFCRQTQECRRYSRRYVYLYTERQLSKAEALGSVLRELTGEM